MQENQKDTWQPNELTYNDSSGVESLRRRHARKMAEGRTHAARRAISSGSFPGSKPVASDRSRLHDRLHDNNSGASKKPIMCSRSSSGRSNRMGIAMFRSAAVAIARALFADQAKAKHALHVRQRAQQTARAGSVVFRVNLRVEVSE